MTPPVVRHNDHGRFRSALELSQLEDGMTIIDWGCADGSFACAIAERCPAARVLACDIPYQHGPPKVSAPNLEYHVMDEGAPRLPLADHTVDRVFSLEVIEHMGSRSRPAALAEMRRVLKRDGLLVITVPHKGLLAWTDIDNIRMRFPRLHRAVFELVRGRRFFEERYGADPLVNFSHDATEHHHFSEPELAAVLGLAGFAPVEHRYFGAFYVVPWSLVMLLEGLRRVTGRRLNSFERAAWTAWLWAADARPPRRLADHIGIAATPAVK